MIIKLNKLLILSSLFIIILNINAYSLVNLEFKNNPQIDASKYPLFSAIVRAGQNGNYFTLDLNNLLLIEDNQINKPFSVSAADPDHWQIVKWYTNLKGTDKAYQDSKTIKVDTTIFIASVNNDLGINSGYYLLYNSFCAISITNSRDKFEPDMFFGITNQDSTRGIIVNAASALIANGQEQPVHIDSIKVNTDKFSYKWYGNVLSKQQPPVNIFSPFYYYNDLTFKPSDFSYQRGRFTVYYDGGKKESINLIGNKYEIDRKTVLNVIQPNGGEILTPCQTYLIKWKGSAPDIPTYLFYSINNGKNWTFINSLVDSSYLWTVPDAVSNTVLIKATQNFTNTYSRNLVSDPSPVRKIAYKQNGRIVCAAQDNGYIYEWDIFAYSKINSYNISKINYPVQRLIPKGLDYFGNDSNIVATYSVAGFFGSQGPDTLAYIKIGNSIPYKKVQIKPGYIIKKTTVDYHKKFIAVIPTFYNQIQILNVSDGSLINTLTFKFPVSSFAFSPNSDTAAVCLMDGNVKFISLIDFSEIGSIDLSYLPLIQEISISPNGKFLSVGCKPPTPSIVTGNTTEIHVIEISSGMTVRTLRATASETIGLAFNITSSLLLIGSAAQPQIALWDLPDDNFIGSLSGSADLLTDFKFSPEGHSIATSSETGNNLTVRFLTYPEADSSDNFFSIVKPVIKIDSVVFTSRYLGTQNDTTLTASLCNIGSVPIIIDNTWMSTGTNFKIINFKKDSVLPGQCFNVSISFVPLDTGKIADSLILSSCSANYIIPLRAKGLNRNIYYYQNIFDFGELCIGDTLTKDILFARNDDPVPLKLNSFNVNNQFNSAFSVISQIKDTILQPGQSITLKIKFAPSSLGLLKGTIQVLYSDQVKYYTQANLQGVGIGTIIQFSHNNLRFVPEISNRKVSVKNVSKNPITITNINFNPNSGYSVITVLPVSINPQDSAYLELNWDGKFNKDVIVSLEAQPCVANSQIVVGPYSGTSRITLPYTEGDPKGEASIFINFTNSEIYPYMGIRSFETEFSINPRMFLPETIKSDFGTATITRNEILADKRVIGIKVEGDFTKSGIVAVIKGIVGLAETDTSTMLFNTNSIFWGKSVQDSIVNGLFKLINLCDNRRIIQNVNAIEIKSLSPNPSMGSFLIEFNLVSSDPCTIEIYDYLGNKISVLSLTECQVGTNYINYVNNLLVPGTYKLVIRQGINTAVTNLVIIK